MPAPTLIPQNVPDGKSAKAPPLSDFADWLSPMIVKELRQGLRTWVFVSAFIVLQAILVMTLLISSMAGNAEAASYMFWMLVVGVVVFIMPLRGFNALAGEIKAETLDLLMLTRLDAFRIAAGKWAALVAQSALISISVLPYVMLRYFGGGVDLVGELIALLLCWLLSAAVTAVAVSCSALPSVILRGFLLVGTYVMTLILSNLVILSIAMRQSAGAGVMIFLGVGTPKLWVVMGILLPLWTFICYFLLDVGATTVAPLAANHATRKRLISLSLMMGCLGLAILLPDHRDARDAAVWCLCAVGALAALDCLTELPATSPSVFAPFMRRGLIGRWAAAVFSPGWGTGLAFYAIIWILVLGGLCIAGEIPHSAKPAMVIANTALAPLTPLALSLMFFRGPARPLGTYLVCTILLAVFSLLLSGMAQIGDSASVWQLGMITPVTALFTFDGARGDAQEISILAGGLATGLMFFIYLLMRLIPVSKAMHHAMAAAKSEHLPPPEVAEP